MSGTIFYTSDTHFLHDNVARRRGFDAAAEHDEVVIERWNDRVKPGDTVWHLGDVTRGSSTYDDVRALEMVTRLNGTIHLIAGNHDAVHPLHRDSHKHLRLWMEVLASVQPFARRRANGEDLLLSHFPYRGDHGDIDRHPEFRLPDKGFKLLHGHLHGDRPHLSNMVDVGVDAWNLFPVAHDEVVRLLF